MLEGLNTQTLLRSLAKGGAQREAVQIMALRLAWLEAATPCVGPSLARHSAPVKINKDQRGPGRVLVVVCSASAIANELQLAQVSILANLAARGPFYQFNKIFAFAGQVPPLPLERSPAPEAKANTPSPEPDPRLVAEVERLTAPLEPESLRQYVGQALLEGQCQRQLDLKRGAHICPRCGATTWRSQDLCLYCELEVESLQRWWAVYALNKKPWLGMRSLNRLLRCHHLPSVDHFFWRDLKRQLCSQRRAEIWKALSHLEKGSPLPDSQREAMLNLISLRSGRSPVQMDEELARRILKPALWKIYDSGRVQHRPPLAPKDPAP